MIFNVHLLLLPVRDMRGREHVCHGTCGGQESILFFYLYKGLEDQIQVARLVKRDLYPTESPHQPLFILCLFSGWGWYTGKSEQSSVQSVLASHHGE